MNKKVPTHMIVAASSWISKIIISIIQLFVIKILIQTLGEDKYSAYAILTGLMGWFTLFDFGIGTSLQNYISEYRAKEKDYTEIITITFIFIFIISVFLIILLYFLSPYISSKILKIFTFLDPNEKKFIFFITGFYFIINNIGLIFYKTLYAKDKGYIANLIPVLGYGISLLLILYLKTKNISNLAYAITFSIAPNAFIPFILILHKFKYQNLINFNYDIIKMILKRAYKFWLFALLANLVLSIDYIILSQYSNSKDIVIYNILSRIFLFGFFIYSSFLAALWPVFSFNIIKGKTDIVYQYTKRYLSIGIIYMLFFTFLVLLFIKPISKFFLADMEIKIPFSIILFFGFYYLLRVWTDTFAMILQSANILRPFIIFVPIQVLISIFLQIKLIKIYGLYGIVTALIFSFILTVVWALPYYTKKKVFKDALL